MARWIKKTKDPIYAASKTFTSSKDKQAKIEGIEGDTPSKWQLEKGGVAILTGYKLHFKLSGKKRQWSSLSIYWEKGSILQEDKTIVNMHPILEHSTPIYTKQKQEVRGEILTYVIKVGDFNILPLVMSRSHRQKSVRKEYIWKTL